MTRPYAGRQTTLQDQATVAGIGVHSGSPATLTLHPAEADTGIVFLRCGVGGQPDRELSANFRSVTATEFATALLSKGFSEGESRKLLGGNYRRVFRASLAQAGGPT